MIRKKYFAIFSVFCLLTAGCTGYSSETVTENGITCYLSKDGRRAFASQAELDLSASAHAIVIPETVANAKVEQIGGFFGNGVPAPFDIVIRQEETWVSDPSPRQENYCVPITVHDVAVDLNVPENVGEMTIARPLNYGRRTASGEIEFLNPVIRVMKNGVKLPDSEIEYSTAAPEVSEETLEERLIGKYSLPYAGGEIGVFEVFRAFDSLYVQASRYKEGNEIASGALEIVPDDPALLAGTADSFDATLKYLGGAGQEKTDAPASPRYRILVRKDAIELNAMDSSETILTAYGLEYERDHKMKSHFPCDFSSVPDDKPQAEDLVIRHWKLTDGILDNGESLIRVYPDGTILIQKKDTEKPELFRGICAVDEESGVLSFIIRAFGAPSDQISGKVRISDPMEDLKLSAEGDAQSAPLLKEGEREHIFSAS